MITESQWFWKFKVLSKYLQGALFESVKIEIIELQHDKTSKVICAPSEDSEQPGHLPSLIRVFACTQWVAKDPRFLHANSEDADRTVRMPRLIWVFAGCTGYFVGSVVLQLNSKVSVHVSTRSLPKTWAALCVCVCVFFCVFGWVILPFD